MLPSGKFPRFALLAALLAALFLIYDLEFIRSSFARLLLSKCLNAFVLLLAALSCFYVAARSAAYARQVWFLLGIALTIETIGQFLTTYYQSFLPGSTMSAVPSDVFFFAWAAPVFMILLPQSEEQTSGWDYLRLLDFLQIAIVGVTAYLYFFYFTSRWKTDQYSLVRGILMVYIARDLLLAIAFIFRSRSTVPSWFRRFAFVLALVFFASAASDTDYLVTLAAAVSNASWGDLLAMLPYFFVIGFAAFWPDREAPAAAVLAPTSRAENRFLTHYFPIFMPLLVITMARAIAPQHSLVAWLTLGASVLCSSIRLILTNRRQARISANLLATERALLSSQQLLAVAYFNSPDGFTINTFPEGKYVEVNEGFTRLTGFSREEAIGKSPVEMNLWVNPATRQVFLSELAEKGMVRNFEMQYHSKSGQIRHGLLSGSIATLDGRQHAIHAVRDVTEMKAAQEAVRTSEERFRTLVENVHVSILSCDAKGYVTFANQAILNLLGLTKEQLIGKNIYDLGLTAMREDGTPIPDSERPVSTVIRTRKPLLNQLLGYRRPDSPAIGWTIMDVVPEHSPSGELLGMLISLTDVTEQRHATEAVRQNEERFRTFVENLHVGVVSCDAEARIQYANPAILDLFGFKREEVIGKTEVDLGFEVLRENGTVLPASEGLIPTLLASRTPLTNRVIGWRHTSTSETVWTLLDAVPQCDASGNVARILLSLTDLTSLRQATEALRESEERFRTLVRDLHVAVVLHNPDATVQFANKAALDMFGTTPEQVYGRTSLATGWSPVDVHGNPIPFEKLPAPTVVRTKLPVRNVVMGWRSPLNNEITWIYGHATPQYSAGGAILRVISAFSDITEMKNAERSIHQLSTELLKLQDEERRRIGRELHDGMAQTVLAVNLSLAQLRQSGQPLSDASVRALDKARALLQQMSREIRTLSYLLHPPLLDDLGLVTALKEYVNGFSERSGIDTALELPSRFRRLPQMAETALFRITQESLSNIQRHSGSQRAKVCLREDTEAVVLEVTDYGHGMALPSNGESARPPRLGVGIPGMRERMAQLGGYLDIESNSHGTTVRARILFSAPALKDALHESPSSSYRG